MPQLARLRRPDSLFFWSLALAGLGQLALFCYATSSGLAGTSDSRYYLHAAATLRKTGHLLNPDGSAYRYWPPLYPVLISLGGASSSVRWLHLVSLLGSIVIWSWVGRQLLPTRRASVLPWLLALSTPVLLVSKFVWAESVFLLLFATYAGVLFRALTVGKGGWWLVATALGALLTLERTAGFFLLAGIGFWVILASIAPAVRRAVVWHLLVSILAGLAWQYYALLLAAPSVYHINRGWLQAISSVADYGFVLWRWLLPLPAAWREILPLALWAIGLTAGFAWLWPRSKPSPTASTNFLKLLWLATASYLLLLIVATVFSRSASGLYDAERYASVLVAPVFLLLLSRWPTAKRPWVRWANALLIGGILLYNSLRITHNAQALRQLPPIRFAPIVTLPTTAAPPAHPGKSVAVPQ